MVALLGIATEIRETAWRHDRQLYQNKFDHVEAGRDARIGTCILDRRQAMPRCYLKVVVEAPKDFR
jgi:hypothetical protein